MNNISVQSKNIRDKRNAELISVSLSLKLSRYADYYHALPVDARMNREYKSKWHQKKPKNK